MDLYKNKSILHNSWNLINTDERKVLYISQKFKLSFFLSKVIVSNNNQEEEINLNGSDDLVAILSLYFSFKLLFL